MTFQQAIQAATNAGGAYIQKRGEAFAVIGKSYPGHSNGVWEVSRKGVAERCK